MKEGEYSFYVRCFASRGGKTGFRAEIEFDGNIYSFNYDKPLHQAQSVAVAKVMLKDGKFSIKELLPSSTSTREIWGVNSNQFVPVSVAMYLRTTGMSRLAMVIVTTSSCSRIVSTLKSPMVSTTNF